MIYTCTLNPSLDYYMEFEKELTDKRTNRSQLEYYEAGGKGINVSIVLSNLMIPSRAVGFLGGFTKDFYISLLDKYEYLQPNFSYIDGHTRINVKTKAGLTNVDLNAAGPYITQEHMKTLKTKIDRLDENDIFVFSGTTLSYLERSVEEMIEMCCNNNVRVVLDTSVGVMKKCLKYNPYLICPSLEELEDLVGYSCSEEEKVKEALKKCVQDGAKHVLLYRRGKESIMATEEGVYRAKALTKDGAVVDTVGTQDAMVAGFVMSSLRTPKSIECFRYANCCKEATLFLKSLEIRERINEIYSQIEIEEI